jgi:arylformamidase
MSGNSTQEIVWLSHPWGPSCPAYGGGTRIELCVVQSIFEGASSNSLKFTASNHIGTHIDAPRHFIADGRTIDQFTPDELIYKRPFFLKVTLESSRRHISPRDFEALSPEELSSFRDCDILLLKTGAEQFRQSDRYWADGPGLDIGLADFIRNSAPKCRAVGIDSISITSFSDREKGRKVHREFLGGPQPLLLIEDMSLITLGSRVPAQVIVAPLRIESGDGSPVTVMGFLA